MEASLVAATIWAMQAMTLQSGKPVEPVRRVVVSIPDRKLALVENGRTLRVYDIAVGKASTPSPAGTFEVIARVTNPTWWGPKEVVAAGPANPLGTRWIGLSRKSYGIHGTNSPKSIGKRASGGCIRMRNQDVEELFTMVRVGDVVEMAGVATVETAKLFAPATPAAETLVAGGGL